MKFPDLRENTDRADSDWRRYYSSVRRLPSGELAGLSRMAYTTGLVVGLDDTGYRGRYCYERTCDAQDALDGWTGEGDPSGPWIKYKGTGGERLGPGAVDCHAQFPNSDERLTK
jgi:hypothetical protein